MRKKTKDIKVWDKMVDRLKDEIVGKKEIMRALHIKDVLAFKTYFYNTTGYRLYTLKRSFLYMPKTQEEYEEVQRKLTPYAKGFSRAVLKTAIGAYECQGLSEAEIRRRISNNPMNHYFAKEMKALGYTM